ncbi:MAG: hypothetical protein ACR2LK_01290, partial [Solirubrobacteraceae bacterium]
MAGGPVEALLEPSDGPGELVVQLVGAIERPAAGTRMRSCSPRPPPRLSSGTVVEGTMASSTHRRRAGLASCAVALAALVVPAGASAQSVCPGAAPACPYVSSAQIGQRGSGVLRFPQTISISPAGEVYVGDQSSSVVQVFSREGVFLREIGRAGFRKGEMTSVGALTVAPDNTLFVADGENRIDRYDPAGRLLGSFGAPGNGVGQFHFGKGGGNDAPAGGGLVATSDWLFV